MKLKEINATLVNELRNLHFGPPVTHVYNPLEYAREAYEQYLLLYGRRPKEVVMLGMNPGPWGMAQTGVPFGEIEAVRDWMQIKTPIGAPRKMHPKRPVKGFDCRRREVSGRRLWGWIRKTYGSPETFFARFFVANYCPLLFIEASGRNRTPNNIRMQERKPLLAICDKALRRTVEWIKPRFVVGVGRFAKERAEAALDGLDVTIGMISHPSPANPKANQGWDALVVEEIRALGIEL
jgi:single-strand selective monofunctional uracil DNA glycosylase